MVFKNLLSFILICCLGVVVEGMFVDDAGSSMLP
jgi:hypothetical protein